MSLGGTWTVHRPSGLKLRTGYRRNPSPSGGLADLTQSNPCKMQESISTPVTDAVRAVEGVQSGTLSRIPSGKADAKDSRTERWEKGLPAQVCFTGIES